MAEPSSSTPSGSDWLSQLQQSYSQIRFGPGIAGKTSRATLGLFAAWALIFWRLGTDIVLNACLMGGGIILTSVYCWWVHKTHAFAEKFPQVALLEGAELIEYQKWEASINGKSIPMGLPVPGPDALLPSGDPEQ